MVGTPFARVVPAVVAVPSRLSPTASRVQAAVPPPPVIAVGSQPLPRQVSLSWLSATSLPAVAAALVVLPVFVQAPWVRAAPMSAALFTAVLLLTGILLERHPERRWSQLGSLLVGFSGSWLGGALFWGWGRLHPLWHLPVEAFALPLAVAGLGGRWRLAGCFYLSSLLGTAATDGAMALSGVMRLWPRVLSGPLEEAPRLLQNAALSVLHPLPLSVVVASAGLLIGLCLLLWPRGLMGRIAAVTLATTLAVDGLFLAASLAAPRLTGLI